MRRHWQTIRYIKGGANEKNQKISTGAAFYQFHGGPVRWNESREFGLDFDKWNIGVGGNSRREEEIDDMKCRYREVRRIYSEELRELCIKNRWYTKGTAAEYAHLLNELAHEKENITTDDIVEIAQDVVEHSDTDQEFTSICFDIARIAVTFFEEV